MDIGTSHLGWSVVQLALLNKRDSKHADMVGDMDHVSHPDKWSNATDQRSVVLPNLCDNLLPPAVERVQSVVFNYVDVYDIPEMIRKP